jgi:hypothetical protein
MHIQIHGRSNGQVLSAAAISRSLTVTDVCLCLVPISLFLSIMSLV